MSKLLALAALCACSRVGWSANQYYIAFCVTTGHAFVTFIDGSTDQSYGRGFWAVDFAKKSGMTKATPVPNAGASPAAAAGTPVTNPNAPSSDSDELQAVLGTAGVVVDEGGRRNTAGGTKCIYYRVPQADYDKAANFVNTLGRDYYALGNNCVGFAREVLFAAGKRPPCEPEDLIAFPTVTGAILNEAAKSNPQDWYNCLNQYLKRHGPLIGRRDAEDRAVIAYGEESDVLAGYGIPVAKAQAPSVDARLAMETNERHESAFRQPGIVYMDMARLGRAPVTTALLPQAGAGAACGADCSEATANAPLTLRPDFQPSGRFQMWWDWGDGTTMHGVVPSHAYVREGSYLVTMRYFDEAGARRVGWHRVKVSTALPRQESTGEAKVTTETDGGLTEVTFDTLRGRVHVRLPDDVTAGDTISGTVWMEPEGKSAAERAESEEWLKALGIAVAQQGRPVFFDWARWSVPASDSSMAVALTRGDGRVLATAPVAVRRAGAAAARDYVVPSLMQTGKPVPIAGPFDGDCSTTVVTAGGQEIKVLAESPRKVVIEAPKVAAGPVQLQIRKSGGAPILRPTRIAGVRLQAGKYDLTRGERTELTGKVEGLRGLQAAVELRLKVTTPGIVQMQGGAEQRLLIQPKDVAPDGTYSFRRTLTGLAPGGFGITSTLTAGSGGR
jgi:hypothetical protein